MGMTTNTGADLAACWNQNECLVPKEEMGEGVRRQREGFRGRTRNFAVENG